MVQMGMSPTEPIIQSATTDAMLNNNGLNISDRLNFVTCERSLNKMDTVKSQYVVQTRLFEDKICVPSR